MKSTGIFKQAVLSALLLLAAALAWTNREEIALMWQPLSAEETRPDRTPRATPVIVARTEVVNDDITFSAIGTGFAQRSVTLRAPSDGIVTELLIEPGKLFAKDEVLLRLDDRDERLAVELAEARLDRASSEQTRYQQLQDTGVAAISRFEDVQTAFRVARIALEQARADLADRTLRAPFDGVSGLALVEVGDRISLTDAVASFDDRTSLLVEFQLPEALLFRVAPGLPVAASTPAVPNRSFDGQVAEVDSRLDEGSRSAQVRALVDNGEDLLRPGASFSIRLDLPGSAYPSVPELALQFAEGSLHVWRVRDEKAEKVEVQMVRRRAGRVILDGPLEAGDAIVVEGTQRLRPGLAVETLNAAPGANS